MQGRQDVMQRIVLHIRQLFAEHANVMIVDQCDRSDHFRLGALGSLLDELVANQVSKSFRTIGVASFVDQLVETLQKVGIDGHSDTAQFSHVDFSVADRNRAGQQAQQTRATLVLVDEFCTCGAQLVPDSRFCHKCGKPQGDFLGAEAAVETAPPPVPVDAPAPVAPAKETPGAVLLRVGLMAGAATALFIIVPLPPVIQLLWQMIMLLAGGFFAVYIYNRRTGKHVNLRTGAYIGWIAGLFCFLIMLILFTVSMIATASGDGLQQSFREAIAASGNSNVIGQFEELLRSPVGIAVLLFGTLFTLFVMVTVLPTIGGVLGAKVLEKE